MSILKERAKKNDHGISAVDLKTIALIVSKYPQIEEVLLFGSRAKRTHEKGSDIDLCLKGEGVDAGIVSKVHWDLEEETLLPYFFDVVAYGGLSNLELKDHIDRRGEVIYRAEF